jgi:hypothetical protein
MHQGVRPKPASPKKYFPEGTENPASNAASRTAPSCAELSQPVSTYENNKLSNSQTANTF